MCVHGAQRDLRAFVRRLEEPPGETWWHGFGVAFVAYFTWGLRTINFKQIWLLFIPYEGESVWRV
jgi:hypothetical protein